MKSTDQAWEKWGKLDPYYAVLTEEKFHNENLSLKHKKEFFASGENEVDYILNIMTKIDKNYSINTAVDFGCGVGRLAIPLARKFKHTIGLDVSESMIKEARVNIPLELRKKLSFKKTNDNLKNLPKNYNLVVSEHVFQHIPLARGYAMTNKLLKNLDSGGFAALHFTIHDSESTFIKLLFKLRSQIFFINWLANLYKKRPITTPNMQMNVFKIDHLLKIYRDNGIPEVFCKSNVYGRGFIAATIIGKKSN